MFVKQRVQVRPHWENRVHKNGLTPTQWSEGEVLVFQESPQPLVEALSTYMHMVHNSMNQLLEEVTSEDTPSFPNLSSDEVYKAISSSWGHQDMCLPVRFDIAVMKHGGFGLLSVKGDYLEGMIAAASVSKAWHAHHYDGSPGVSEVNFLQEHISAALQPFGKHASPPSVSEVTVLSSENFCSTYLANCLGEHTGINLSKLGVAGLDALEGLKRDSESPLMSSIIKVDSWKKILEEADEGSPWLELFKTPRAFTIQPPWVYALDEMINFRERDLEDEHIDFVLNVWVDISSNMPVPLVVSSEYKPGYEFENSIITPVILNFEPAEQE